MSTRHGLAQSERRLTSGSPSADRKATLKKSYSMPLSIRETTDVPNGSLTIKASESLPYPSIVRSSKSEEVLPPHQLDRYGFILNMDSRGNVVNELDQSNLRQLHQDQSSLADDATDSLLNALQSTAPEPVRPSSPPLHPPGAARTPREATRTARRVRKWDSMLRWPLLDDAITVVRVAPGLWERVQRRARTIQRRLRKGIPQQAQRAQVWPRLCHVEERRRENPGLYRLLVETSAGSPGGAPTPSNGSATQQKNAAVTDATNQTRIEISYTKKIGPTLLPSSLNHRPHQRCQKQVIAFQYTKSFKNVQDTIERDLHRTFPRHSLFYTECGEDESTENGHSNWSRPDALIQDDEQSSDTRELQQKSICGTTEIHSLMRELDLVRSTAPVVDPAPPGNADGTRGAATGRAKMLDGAGGQARLRRVLNAYGTYDREIGYCQGMNFIAAMFLTLVSEEIAFWMLVCKYAFCFS
jgi:Rab-GTPase-TBC domain